MTLVLLATAWGSRYGGINSFNRDFAIGLASELGRRADVLCSVPGPSDEERADAERNNVVLVPLGPKSNVDHFDPDWVFEVQDALKKGGYAPVSWWIGHDVSSGPAACRGSTNYGGKVVLIHHMAYLEYKGMMGQPASEVDRMAHQQRALFRTEGAVLCAVGPLLRESCATLSNRRVVELVPGFPEIPYPPSRGDKIRAITFGRMDRATDAVKQGRLAAAAFGEAFRRAQEGLSIPAFQFPHFYLLGIRSDVYGQSEEIEVKKLVKEHAGTTAVVVLALPFDEDREAVLERLASADLALMLSAHEGFGLTGWEAVAAEVPLVLSKNSGLYRLVDERLGGAGIGCVKVVELRGDYGEDGALTFKKEDIETVSRAILEIVANVARSKANAKTLKDMLIKELGCTWKRTARDLLFALGLDAPAGTETVDALPVPVTSADPPLVGPERLGWTRDGTSGELVRARSRSNDYDHRSLIEKSSLVRIVANDGLQFFRKYKDALVARAMKGSATTEICLLAPTGEHLETIARRSDKTAAEQSFDIQQSIETLKKIFVTRPDELILIGLKSFLPYCLFQYDDLILVSIYMAFERKDELPMILLRPTGESSGAYELFRRNTERLFQRAKDGQHLWFDLL